MEVEIHEPKTRKQLDNYYALRWKLLRKPLNRPRGSEKDEHENESIHLVAVTGGKFVGVGRVHLNSCEEADIRYLAVEEDSRGKGVGSLILNALEMRAKALGAKYAVLNSRETLTGFYKKCGYRIIEPVHKIFGTSPHWKMKKNYEWSR